MKPKVCLVMSDAITLRAFLLDQVSRMAAIFDLTIVTRTGGETEVAGLGISAKVVHFRIERPISLWQDLVALLELYLFFRHEKFELVQTYTPKAGLLGMLAAWLANIPNRSHWFLGQVWATKSGMFRAILKAADKVTSYCATSILVDSHSQHEFVIREGISSPPKSWVPLNGSICGVDSEKWAPNPETRAKTRLKLDLPESAMVFLYMSRFTRDKGALVMAEAFSRLAAFAPTAYLLMIGPDEEGLRAEIDKILEPVQNRVLFRGFTTDPVSYFVAADALCLPSFREGFGLALINASAVGIPALASRIYGSIDAVVENKTGLLHTPGDSRELAEHMAFLYHNPDTAKAFGVCGRARVMKDFSQEKVSKTIIDRYVQMIGNQY